MGGNKVFLKAFLDWCINFRMSFHDFDKQIKSFSENWTNKIEKMILPKTLNLEELNIPKLSFFDFDQQEPINFSTQYNEPDAMPINDESEEIKDKEKINNRKEEKEQINDETERINYEKEDRIQYDDAYHKPTKKEIEELIQNSNFDKYSDPKTPKKFQQIVSKYSGLNDIAGHNDIKQILRESIIYPSKYPQLFTDGRTAWSRALLYGVPGVGKTALVHAIAAEANLPLYQISSADITSAWFGKSEKLIRELFDTLGNQRCLLLIDEVDALCRKSVPSDASHCRRAATELLIQIQNYEDSPMFLICTTNCPWEIETAFLRRFQQRVYIPLPDFDARKQIILSKINQIGKIDKDPQLDEFVRATEGLTGSDLINMTRHALMIPLRDMESAIYWKKTEYGFMPCDKKDVKAFKCSLKRIPSSKVLCRSLEMKDLWHALKNTDATVTKEDLIPFQDFRTRRKIK